MNNSLNDGINLTNNNGINVSKISESVKSRKLSLKKCTVWIEPILLSTFAMGVALLCYYGMRQLNSKNADPAYEFDRFRVDGFVQLPPKQRQAVLNLSKLSKLIIFDTNAYSIVTVGVSPVDHTAAYATFSNVKLSDDDLVDLRSLPTLSMLTIDSCPELTDQFLEYLAGSIQLTFLHLRKLNIADKGLKHLSGLVQLDSFDLSSCKAITSFGMSHLKNLKHLRLLGLSNTKVSDAGLEQLKGLTNLEGLSLGHTSVTDSGLQYLKNMRELRNLSLGYTKISGVGFSHLRDLEKLEYLDLSFSQLSNAGVEQISYLKSLETLALGNTGISDEGIRHLKGLPNLEHLSLYNTKVTVAGVKELQTALPRCTIKWSNED